MIDQHVSSWQQVYFKEMAIEADCETGTGSDDGSETADLEM